MADILRVTAPLINKNQIPTMRPSSDPSVPFSVIDTSEQKVNRLNDHKEILSQNNTLQLQADTSSILKGMLNDPNSSVRFLRSIYLLQEVVNMLPIANDPISEDIVALYQALLVKPENLVEEMLRQDMVSTQFRGDLFDALRQMLNDAKAMFAQMENDGSLKQAGLTYTLNEMKYDIASLMKALNQTLIRQDILESVSNHLSYLSSQFQGLKLGYRLEELAESFHVLGEMVKDNAFTKDSIQYYSNLKQQLMTQIAEVKKSLLYNPKIEKNISILQYNLSRFHYGEEYLESAIKNMLKYIESEEEQQKFKDMIKEYIQERSQMDMQGRDMMDRISNPAGSKVMQVLTEIISKEASGKHLMTTDQIERIVQSLLTSPSNFTPLLHFVLPMDFHGLKSFGEMWIDPNADEEASRKSSDNELRAHVLMAMDVDVLGRFEIEAKTAGDKLNLFIYCPKDYAEAFQPIQRDIAQMLRETKFRKPEISVLPLERPRTLMEVFENLPNRRTGINVTI